MKSQLHPFLFAGLISFILFSCQKNIDTQSAKLQSTAINELNKSNQSGKYNTFYGHQVQLGDGMVRTFTILSHTGVPTEIGVEMTAAALNGLGEEMIQLSFPFHKKTGEATPFDHILLDWNPNGHEPFFYELPHFDFHFYMIGKDERLKISASSPLMEEIPQFQYWPEGYVPTPGGVPQMGKHWINPLSPEISGGQLFTHTFIYGSYAGEFIFAEPMITRDFLLSEQPVHMNYGQPLQFMETQTYYPTKYNIYKMGGKYYISLSDFVWRP